MGAHSSQARSTGRRQGSGRHRARSQRHLEPYNWLGAGAIAVSVTLGAAFVGGSGIARADEDAAKSTTAASSSASTATASRDGSQTPKPPRATHRKKTPPEAPPSDAPANVDTATTPKVADSQPDSAKAADATSSDSEPTTEGTEASASGGKGAQSSANSSTQTSDPSTKTDGTAAEESDAVASDPPTAADTDEASEPNPVDVVDLPTAFAFSPVNKSDNNSPLSTAKTSAAALVGPAALVKPAALPNPLSLVGAVIAYDLKGAQHLMNPVIAGALGVWHLQTGINELKTLHLIGGALDIVSGVLALATPILNAVPVPGATLLIPVTAVLGSTTATVNTIGQGLLHW